MYGQLNSDQIVLEKNCLWDMIRINWKEVFVTLNSIILQMPKTVKISIIDRYRLRKLVDKHSLLLHVMLRQVTSWYSLYNTRFLTSTTIGRIRDLTLYFRWPKKLALPKTSEH